jgi:TolA-binding protein
MSHFQGRSLQINLESLSMQTDPENSGCSTPAEPIFESRVVYMRFFWLLFLLGPIFCSAEGAWEAENEEEALFLRRIADFWQEGEYQLAKSQMEEFIVQYPESPFSDALCGALGDLSLREKNFPCALNHYAQIQSSELSDRVFLSRMQCLYEMQWYANLADECEAYLEEKSDIHVTYYLAIALYHQCLNASKDPAMLAALAERARPYFEILSQSELSSEVAQGFAHLCCILKDYPKAAEIYLSLAQKEPALNEEMLFQAGLIQSEFNKELALQTFDEIARLGKKKAKEAAYNQMVLSFDMGHHEELTQISLNQLPSDRTGMAHLFLGRSFLNLKKYPEAIAELKLYVQSAPVSDTLHAALLSLLDASYQCDDLASLDQAIARFSAHYPEDSELPKAFFSRAQILKRNQNSLEAQKQIEQLLAQFPHFSQRPQALFELAHLAHQNKAWEACYDRALSFLTEFPEHELSLFAWRYYISASAELATGNPEFKEQLMANLTAFLEQPLSESEKNEWQFLLAKTQFEVRRFEEAMRTLENHQTPNAHLLRALIHKDGFSDLSRFCEMAEQALAAGATLVDPAQIHISLFNAYLQIPALEKGAEHLYAAFEAKADIKTENLLWLADFYYSRLLNEETNFPLANRTAAILEKIERRAAIQNLGTPNNECKAAIQNPKDDASLETPNNKCKAALHLDVNNSEPITYKLAKVYSLLGRLDEEITLLEKLPVPSPEAELLLAEGYAKRGITAKALQMFDAIVSRSATVRSPVSASAALQGARLKLASPHPDLAQIATQLKNLVVQKTLMNEPVHLEAALDYVDLQAQTDPSKKLSLLKKTKSDFENNGDLLSKDYHAARLQNSSKNRIYQGYMQFINAEILAAESALAKDPQEQKNLQAKAKDLLLQIVQEPTARALHERCAILLNDES